MRSTRDLSRRDFLNGTLLAAGGAAAVSTFAPMRAFAALAACDPSIPIGSDPNALRGGNLPEVYRVGHWLRDDRLTFSSSSVTLAGTSRDPTSGTFPVIEDTGKYDVIVVGSGVSGLAAAFFISRQRPGTRVLVLDNQALPGGNAARDDATPIPTPGATAGAYAVAPYADFLYDFYGTIGIDWTQHIVAAPFYNYWFDDHAPFVNPGTKSWNIDTYAKGQFSLPYPDEIVRDIHESFQDLRNWYNRAGSPTDPADNADPKYDYLANKTFHEYLTVERGFHPAVSDFYTRYAVDALAGTCEQVNAFTSISFLGAEFNAIFAFPGGTAGIARHAVNWLVPGSIEGETTADVLTNPFRVDQLDVATNAVRIRQNATVLRADTEKKQASVVYYLGGQFYRARAKAVILAGQGHTAHHLVGHLLDDARLEAWEQFVHVPVAVASVVLDRARPLVDLGLGYDQYWWGSKYWADFTIADWWSPARNDPNRPTVLTFYGANFVPPEEQASERVKLLTTPFCAYEDSLREDLNRILAPGGFDFDRDVSAVYLYRWGHGMIFPTPGFPFGAPTYSGGQAIRTPSARHIARAQLGRISFAAQDTESSPALESAIGAGLRTATEALADL